MILIGRGLDHKNYDEDNRIERITKLRRNGRFKICSCECTNNIIHSAITGDISEGETPVLIPNTEVKTFSAENTTREALWEDMSLPVFN